MSRRATSAVSVIVVAAIVGACAYPNALTQPVSDRRLTEIYAPREHRTNSKTVLQRILAIDGESHWEYLLSPGHHTIKVETEWSNKWTDENELSFDAIAGRRYLVLAYELHPGQDQAQAMLRPARSGGLVPPAEAVLGGGGFEGAAPLIILTAPIWIPLGNLFWGEKPEEPTPEAPKGAPDSRPFPGCCFVWIEDQQSGQLMDGTRPSGLSGYWVTH